MAATIGKGGVKPLVAGNWKMNGMLAGFGEAAKVRDSLMAGSAKVGDVIICPPATLITALAAASRNTRLMIGAQDCHAQASGAHTGDLSAEMLKDAGAGAVIVGHSERRADHGEIDADVRAKAEAAHRAGLIAIICIGETAEERKAGKTLEVVARQLSASIPEGSTSANTVIAYEPVWAIGTGNTPTPTDIGEVHAALRAALAKRFSGEGRAMRLLYGGSVKPSNAKEIMAVSEVNGALVGGASLKADDFLAIVAACNG